MNSKILFLLASILFLNISLFAFYQPNHEEFILAQKSKTPTPKLEKKKPEIEKKKTPDSSEKKEEKESLKDKVKDKLKEEKEKRERGGRFGDRRF